MVATITNFAIATSESISIALQTAFNISSETLDNGTAGSWTGFVMAVALLPNIGLLGILYVPENRKKLVSCS
jgi:hypothetical protein